MRPGYARCTVYRVERQFSCQRASEAGTGRLRGGSLFFQNLWYVRNFEFVVPAPQKAELFSLRVARSTDATSSAVVWLDNDGLWRTMRREFTSCSADTYALTRASPLDEALRNEVRSEVKRGKGRRVPQDRRSLFAAGIAVGLWIGILSPALAEESTPAAAEDGADGVAGNDTVTPEDRRQAMLQEAAANGWPTAARHRFTIPVRGRDDQQSTGEAYFVGGVHWLVTLGGEPVRLQADQLVVYLFADPTESPEGTAGLEDPTAGLEDPAVTLDRDADTEVLGVQLKRFKFYAQGRVRIDLLARKTHIEADSLFYEHPKGAGVARHVRIRTTVDHARRLRSVVDEKSATTTDIDSDLFWDLEEYQSKGSDRAIGRSPVVVRASIMRVYHFRYFQGEDLEVSNSTYAVPPLSLRSSVGEVYAVEMAAQDRQQLRERAAQDGALIKEPYPARDYENTFIIDPEDTWIYVLDQPVIPLPVGYWDTRWHDYLPINNVYAGHSTEYGAFGGVQWNLNYFARLLPGSDTPLFRYIDKDVEAGFDTIEYQKRGFGWGPVAEYGQRPRNWDPWQLQLNGLNYAGDVQYFAIQDQGTLDRLTNQPIPQRDRDWARVWHRQSLSHLGLIDLEYSDLSDRAFLGEFFEREAKVGKEQETSLYWRRNFLDNLAVSGLVKDRTNDFQTQTERLPEGKAFAFQQSVFGTGFYTDASAQAAQLRQRPDDELGLMSRRFERYDLFNEWAYPVDQLHPAFDFRPFYFTRYTYYSELLDPAASSEDRASLGTGVTVSQQWRRIFHFRKDSIMNRVFGLPNLKHMVVPSMTYLNVHASDLDPSRTIVTDEVDTVDRAESFSLSLRNDFLTRRDEGKARTKTRPLVVDRDIELDVEQFRTLRVIENDISLIIYPQPNRDNAGDQTSFLRLDNAVHVRGASARFWTELNPNKDLRMERADSSVSYRIIPDRMTVSVGDRFTRDRTNAVYVDGRWWMTDKWAATGYWAYDTDEGREIEISGGVTRIFHRFALTFEFIEDVGEDRNRTFFVSVTPVELFEQRRFRERWRR